MKADKTLAVTVIAALMAAAPLMAEAQTRQIQGAQLRAAQAADRAAAPVRDIAGRTDRITDRITDRVIDRAPVRDVRRQVDRARPIDRPERPEPPSNLRQRLRNACFGSDNPPQVCRRVFGQ
jgi:hypothetical protein